MRTVDVVLPPGLGSGPQGSPVCAAGDSAQGLQANLRVRIKADLLVLTLVM